MTEADTVECDPGGAGHGCDLLAILTIVSAYIAALYFFLCRAPCLRSMAFCLLSIAFVALALSLNMQYLGEGAAHCWSETAVFARKRAAWFRGRSIFRGKSVPGSGFASFSYSPDDRSFVTIGNELHMKFNLRIFTGNKFCLFNYATSETGGYVDFDWFRTEAGSRSSAAN